MSAGRYLETCSIPEIIDLARIDRLEYAGLSPENGFERIYGGQLMAQSLQAAILSTEPHLPHGMMTLFARPGTPHAPIQYKVEILRASKSITFCRVDARQSDQVLCHSTVTLGTEEAGLTHAPAMPDVVPAASLPPERERIAEKNRQLPAADHEIVHEWFPFEIRPVQDYGPQIRVKRPPHQDIWVRLRHGLGGSPGAAFCALAYLSDYGMTETILLSHGMALHDRRVRFASVSHTVCFHQRCNAEAWLLNSPTSPVAAEGRGFTRSEIYESGANKLVASASQDGIFRTVEPPSDAGSALRDGGTGRTER